jgi:two-component system sensor histidine kinase KdpD
VLLTLLLDRARGTLNLTSEALLFLLAVVGVACIGGVASAVIASVAASLLLNYWFIPPIGAFTLDDPNALLALAVFAIVAATVAAVVDRSLRLSRRAARATAEAETMSSLAGTIVRGGETIPALLERTRETFGMESVELVGEPPDTSTEAAVVAPAGSASHLVLRGRALPSSERRVLAAFAAHVGGAVERARLAEAAAEVEPVRAADRMRTALLRAVGHDLRTPLAAGWAAVSSLAAVTWSSPPRTGTNSSPPQTSPALEEVLPAALADTPEVEVRDLEAIPAVLADPPLLERVIANLVGNAARHSPAGHKVLLAASAHAGRVELRVVDRGPGLPPTDRDRLFEPFQRLGDTDNTTGLGLGLALSRGLTEAMDGPLTPEDTPGGGLTMVLSLPFAERSLVP